MRQRDLISEIEMLLDSTEALERLHKIPAREIDRLIELLSTQSGVRSLRRLLETIRSSPRGSPQVLTSKRPADPAQAGNAGGGES